MSAPIRGQRDGTTTTRARRGSPTLSRGRGISRGNSTISTGTRARGRGRGTAVTNSKAEGLLEGLRSGTIGKQAADNAVVRGTRGRAVSSRGRNTTRGRGSISVTFNQTSNPPSRPNSPAPTSHKDFMSHMMTKFQQLKQRREVERTSAIRDGFLADPEKKTSLAQAITPVGTCTDMCPEFERAERIVQNMVDRAEKTTDQDTGQAVPTETRMVKRFKRSAAGDDEQLPSDIRTLSTLKKTLDYLIDDVVGGEERLASIHKFVWDRTRSIRNDFSIQQVSKEPDVKIAVECFERIARFHIISLHQLSNPDNLDGENFDAFQDREQLNNTMLSLMYYYDDYRGKISFPNEPEFRAYLILFELQSLQPDLDERLQAWPEYLLKEGRVKVAHQLYAAASNTIFEQGPLRPTIPFPIAQSNAGTFWRLIRSDTVSYLMACVAEMYFSQVRFTALENIWRSAKSASAAQQSKNRDWNLTELTNFLAFDTENQTVEFCEAFELTFAETGEGERYLDFTTSIASLDRSMIPTKQVFSEMVEEKRYKRTLVAVVNGIRASEAIREGLVEFTSTDGEAEEDHGYSAMNDDDSLFLPETTTSPSNDIIPTATSTFNPEASVFTPGKGTLGTPQKSANSSAPILGPGLAFPSLSSTSTPSSIFGPQAASTNTTTPATAAASISLFTSQQPVTPFATSKPPSPAHVSHSPNGKDGELSFSSSLVPSTSPPSSTTPVFSWQPPRAEISDPGSSNGKKTPLFQPPKTGNEPLFASVSQPTVSRAPSSAPFLPPFVSHTLPSTSTFSSQAAAEQATNTLRPSFMFQSLPSFTPQTPRKEDLKSVLSDPNDSTGIPVPRQLNFGFAQAPLSQPSASQAAFTQSIPPTASQLSATSTAQQSDKASPADQGSISPRSKSPISLFLGQPGQPSKSPEDDLPNTVREQPTASETVITPKDRERGIETVARLGTLQPDGLLQQFVEFRLPEILKNVFFTWEKEKAEHTRRQTRQKYLRTKYFQLWKEVFRRSKVRRKSQARRDRYSEFNRRLREENERHFKMEREREEILKAVGETKQVQAAQRHARAEEGHRRQRERENIKKRSSETKQPDFESAEEQTPRKRKSMGEQPYASEQTPRKLQRTTLHRRSQSTTTQIFDKGNGPMFSVLNEPSKYLRNIFSGRPHNGYYFPLEPSKTQDRTQTDYFRLKALGVDPETPINPHTETSLAVAEKLELEKKRSAAMPPRVRRGTPSSWWDKQQAQWEERDKSMPKPKSLPPSPATGSRHAPSRSQSTTMSNAELDEIVRDVTDFNQQLAEATEWMRNERLKIEKGEREEIKRSQNSQSDPPQVDSDGLITVNGYKVRPFPITPGKPLNRLEERIMRTGAHGLATAPIPGTMTYAQHLSSNLGRLQNGQRLKEREKDKKQVSDTTKFRVPDEPMASNNREFERKAEQRDDTRTGDFLSMQIRGGRTNSRPLMTSSHRATPGQILPNSVNGASVNRSAVPNSKTDGEDGEYGGDDDDELLEEEPIDELPYDLSRDRKDGSEESQDLSTGDEHEQDDEDFDEEDTQEEHLHGLSQHAYLSLSKTGLGSNGGTAMSRVTSGTGASAEDALVLDSDSD